MVNPQPGLFIEQTAEHCHVEWMVPEEVPLNKVANAVTHARQATNLLRGPNTVWGFDPLLWERLAPDHRPDNLHRFEQVEGAGGIAPTTQRSVWLWVHGNAWEKVWAVAWSAHQAMSKVAALASELRCYVGYDNRDPMGFIDGTENPAIDDAMQCSVYPPDSPGAGGTAVMFQKWVHDLEAFWALPRHEQEDVIGRTRADSTELPDDLLPATSHVSRNVIEDATGTELKVYRRNTPYASLEEAGTQFIGCSNDPAVLDRMLARMFGATEDSLIDHLVLYSRPVSGSNYFVPGLGSLTRVFGELSPEDV